MRVAPPVDHPVARRGLWAGAAAALAALSAATPLLWAADHLRAMHVTSPGAAVATAMLALMAAGAVALCVWRRQAAAAQARLRWDGAGWQLLRREAAIELDHLAAQIDLGHAALLSARSSTGRTVWLPVDRRDAPASWHGLRVAVAGQARVATIRSTSVARSGGAA